jgi:hypothetical protein
VTVLIGQRDRRWPTERSREAQIRKYSGDSSEATGCSHPYTLAIAQLIPRY